MLTYLAQSAVVTAIRGPLVGLAYLVSLPIAAEIDFRLSDRIRRAACRARAFLRFRRDPALHERMRNELASLRKNVVALDQSLGDVPVEVRA